MKQLAIDIETFSSIDLTKSGVYKYVQSPDFEILLFAYSFGGEPVQVVDLAQGEELPEDVFIALQDDCITKTAFNANFERSCISTFFFAPDYLKANGWECTMAKASMLGLPLSLDAASKALKMDAKKDATGKSLIRYFSMPCKPTKTNGERTRNLPIHDLEKWEKFKDYCKQDVTVELAIRDKISFFAIPDTEKKLWKLDQTINDNGILLDPQFVQNAISLDATFRERLTVEAIELTGLSNPNSAAQLKKWLTAEMPLYDIDILRKEDIPTLIQNAVGYIGKDTIQRVLQIRQEMAKTSIKKYEAMSKVICSDNRVRGLLQYYGANRTGRWAGRLIQVQNLPKNEMIDLDMARKVVKNGDLELLEMLFANVPDTLSQLIRTAFVAPPGKKFLISDFSAIEARVIAWLAGERWRLDVFATHGKIYEASAAQMFKIPLAEITKPLRQKGKVSELALGYQGGPNALEKMGAVKMGVVDEALRLAKIEFDKGTTVYEDWTELKQHIIISELAKLVKMWRNANKKIVELWQIVGNAAINAVRGEPSTIKHDVRFFVDKGIFFIYLPSGRLLSYIRPKLKEGKFGPALTYEGMDQTTKQWRVQETYGGKLVENIVQAIARDCLADAMLRINAAGYKQVLHVHDEIVMEVDLEDIEAIDKVSSIMGAPIPWAKGLPLRADSYESIYYKKD